jgi:acyl-CoA thioesterase-2
LRKVPNDGLCSRIESAYTASYTALSPLSHTCKRTKMSRTAPSAMQQLVSSLDLEPLEQDLFRGTSPQVGWQRVFGGQVIGQALVAAQRTVSQDRPVHSLHAYFMRPGDPAAPIIYTVDRIRDGLSL